MIPYNRPYFDDDDREAAADALSSHIVTNGPKVAEFEDKVAAHAGKRYAITFNSGTSALQCLGAYFKGKTVTIPAITFKATMKVSDNPVIADVDENFGMLNTKIQYDTDVIVGVDYAGHPIDYANLAHSNPGKIIIADAAHSFGVEEYVWGACFAVVFSFGAVKTITTAGEGGALATDDTELYEFARGFRNVCFGGGKSFMTEVQAAVGLSQLKKLDYILTQRRFLAERYAKEIKNRPYYGSFPMYSGTHHLYPFFRDNGHEDLFKKLKENGIAVQKHYPPLKSLPNANRFYARELSLPLYVELSREDQDKVIRVINENRKD